MLRIGFIRGATIIAPIITAVLLANRPKVAIAEAQISKKKKLKEGIDAASLE
jgi:hypothetical protein